MKPIYVTSTNNGWRLQFEYNPLLVEVVKRIPNRKWLQDEQSWFIPNSKENMPDGRTPQWYINSLCIWAINKRLVKSRIDSSIDGEGDYTLPEMPKLEQDPGMLVSLREYQKEGVAYAMKHKRVIFGDQPGLGKSLSLNADIQTPNGAKKMRDIHLGDLVFGCDGKPHKVTGVYPQGKLSVYKITFNDGVSTRVSLEHLWTVRTVNMRRRKQGWRVMTTQELLDNGLTWKSCPSWVASGRKEVLKWEIPMCKPVEYDTKDYFIHPYILGAFIGDGCLVGDCMELSNPDIDKDIHETVSILLKDGFTLTERRKSRNCPAYRITRENNVPFERNAYKTEFTRLGLNVKSVDKFIPSEYMYGDVEQRKDLLAGLMDTDGTVAKGGKITFCTTAKRLADDVLRLVWSLGGQGSIGEYEREDEGKSTEYRVQMQLPFNPFHTSRKRDSVVIRRGNYNSRYIQSIEFDGYEECQCIMVDSKEHTYLTDSFIVTHNTCQAITSAKMLNAFPVLVICPNSLKVNWKREFKKFAGIESIILDNSNINTWPIFWDTKTHGGDRLAKVFIVNYESVKKFFVHKMDPKARPSIVLNKEVDLFKCVIIDESHRCKSAKTQQSKIIERICKGKECVFALTGTPFVNSNVDYIQQLKILGRLEDFGGYKKFSRVYCSGPKMTSNSKQLNYMLRKTCFFRRLKKDVLTELPAKSRQYITCELSNKAEYRQAESNLVERLTNFKKADAEAISRTMRGEVMTRIGILKQISARGKLNEFISFCHDMTDGGDKLIVFGYLKDVIYAIHREFRDCSVVITGDNTIEEKQQAVDRFQNDPDVRIIILNYRSGGVGLTLTAASRVAFIEFPWTYADCEQAEDRAHRIGQTDSVDCYYFLGNGTIDRYMYETIQRKKSGANESTGTDEQTEENMVNLCLGFFSDKIK